MKADPVIPVWQLLLFWTATVSGLLALLVAVVQMMNVTPAATFAMRLGDLSGIALKIERGLLIVEITEVQRPEARIAQDVRVDRREEWAGILLVAHSGLLPTDHAVVLSKVFGIGTPAWVSFFATVLLWSPCAFRIRRARIRNLRALRACCIECGYDLRGSPVLCPECGTPARPSSKGSGVLGDRSRSNQ